MRDSILITDGDMARLSRLVDEHVYGKDQAHLAALANELERATIVPAEEVPADVVTMGSRVVVRDLDTDADTTYTLAYSSVNAPAGENRISVLAPIGTALLGYREGDEIEWRVPGGVRRIRVEHVLSQPARSRPSARNQVRPGAVVRS
jgi:regulator of nucleoside diphosphate kinase